MEINVIYEVKGFFGTRQQTEDTTVYSKDAFKKAMRFLKKTPMTTAVWIYFDAGWKSIGITYDTLSDVENDLVTIIKSSRNATDREKMEYKKALKIDFEEMNQLLLENE